MRQPYRLLLSLLLLHTSNGLVSTLLVGHVLYSADLMSAICSLYLLLIVHRYKYSLVFSTLYQLYYSLPFSTLILSSSLYLKLQPELLLKVVTHLLLSVVTNFIWSYLHQFFNDSHGLKTSLKPLRRPFN